MSTLSRRTLLRASAVATAGVALTHAPAVSAAPALVRAGRPLLSNGVQAGDVAAGRATVWARADRPSRLLVEVSRDSDFAVARRLRGPVVAPTSDLTGKLELRDLPRGTDLHYRIRAAALEDDSLAGPWVRGRLRSAPDAADDVRFLWGADIAGQGWGVNPDYDGFRIADAMSARNADFFLCSGDTVYSDGPLEESVPLPDGSTWRNVVTPEKRKVAETLAEFRGQFRYNLLADNWRRFLAQTPQVNQWDDHEVTNNWYPGEVLDDPRYRVKDVDVLAARAYQAFHEYLPISPVRRDGAGRIYRRIPYGPLLDVFVLDMRSAKDPNTANREEQSDGGVLGREQTAWLKQELRTSRAVWKVIAADLPIGLVVPDGAAQEGIANATAGAPLGRELDIAQLLAYLKAQGIRNVVWLTADVHYTAAHHYAPERAAFDDFDPFWEFVAGPLNAGGFGPNELDRTFGPRVVFQDAPPRPNVSPAEGHQFFGEVDIDGATGAMTVRLRAVDGAVRFARTLEPSRR